MPLIVMQQNEANTHTATIAESGNLSAAVPIPNGHELIAIVMPAVWTAAGITFQASPTNSAFADVFGSDGNEIALVVVATNFVPIAAGTINGARYIKVRSGTSGTPVAQTSARTITLITRPTA